MKKKINIPKEFRYAAKDGDGEWSVFNNKPVGVSGEWRVPGIKMNIDLPDAPKVRWDESLLEVVHTEKGYILRKERPRFDIDDPVMVLCRLEDNSCWLPRHFSGWADETSNDILCWEDGGTSFTSSTVTKWTEFRRPVEYELNRNR